jgi:alginate O-acetyltransferase complex protein AlgI
MLFNSITYLVFFMIVLAVYWSMPGHRMRLGWLLMMSCLFYAVGSASYLILFLLMTAINWSAGIMVESKRQVKPKVARGFLIATLVLDLGNLAFFKYLDFLIQSLMGLGSFLSGRALSAPLTGILLPLGISFYTFQLVAYVTDVYRGDCKAVRNLVEFALFNTFFPKLIAGPILRASQFIGQLDSKRSFNLSRFVHGLDLIAIGLFKKVIIADQIGLFVDQVFAAPDGLGSGTLLLGVYGYAVQIYCDFSGYIDIGRGCAYCLGYELPVNFIFPYLSFNIIEFWRRWNITLSNWLRDYLYIPLGGNRRGPYRTYLNLFITMTLAGLWHGAGWCFVVWGMLHGTALAATRFVHEKVGVSHDKPLFKGWFYRVLAIVGTFNLVCLGWVFFRAPNFSTAFKILLGIANFKLYTSTDLTGIGIVTIGLLAIALTSLALLQVLSAVAGHVNLRQRAAWVIVRPFVYFVVIISVLLVGGRGVQQFIYFQF